MDASKYGVQQHPAEQAARHEKNRVPGGEFDAQQSDVEAGQVARRPHGGLHKDDEVDESENEYRDAGQHDDRRPCRVEASFAAQANLAQRARFRISQGSVDRGGGRPEGKSRHQEKNEPHDYGDQTKGAGSDVAKTPS